MERLAPVGRGVRVLTESAGAAARRVGAHLDRRPHYSYCVQRSAALAGRLGLSRISVVEFGVAGGRGLLALERYCAAAGQRFGVEIEVYGFDTGAGLPEPVDYRDLPYHWRPGFYSMDVEALRARLSTARLVLGNLKDTTGSFFDEFHPAPIAAALFDIDYYSSTVFSLRLFDGPVETRLPRVFCYFDDIIGGDVELYNEFTGERLAINEFNAGHERQKLSRAQHLTARPLAREWRHQIYVLHDFDHPQYCTFVSEEDQQLPLSRALLSRVAGTRQAGGAR
jgi:hypothetical protein